MGEINYFSTKYDRGDAWYEAAFDQDKPYKAVIDISPTYFNLPDVPERIKKFNPNAKIISILRDPIDRAYSHYCMHLRSNSVSENVDQEIKPGTNIFDHSLYAANISRFLDVFPKENVIVMDFDHLKNDPVSYLKECFDLFGVDNSFKPSILEKRFHQKRNRPKHQGFYNFVVNSTIKIRLNPKLHMLWKGIRFLRKTPLVSAFHAINKSDRGYPKISPQRRQELMKLFEPDLAQLAEITGVSYGKWLQEKVKA